MNKSEVRYVKLDGVDYTVLVNYKSEGNIDRKKCLVLETERGKLCQAVHDKDLIARVLDESETRGLKITTGKNYKLITDFQKEIASGMPAGVSR